MAAYRYSRALRRRGVRRNPRSEGTTKLLLIGGALVAGASGIFGNSVKNALGTARADLQNTFHLSTGQGTVTVAAGSGTPAGDTAPNIPGLGPDGVFRGNPADVTRAARQRGFRSAGDAGADQFGAYLWSKQSGRPIYQFAAQDQSTRATFDSVAILGS